MNMLGRLTLACLACGARGYSAPSRPGPNRLARSHSPAMGLTLPPMPPMPEGLPRLDSIGSLPPLPGLPSLPEEQPPWAVQMWVDLLDLIGAIGGAVSSGDTEALARVASDPDILLLVPVGLALTAIAKSISEAPEVPYPALTYDQQSARRHYRVRPGAVAARALEIGWKSAGFGASVGQVCRATLGWTTSKANPNPNLDPNPNPNPNPNYVRTTSRGLSTWRATRRYAQP